MIGTNLEQKRIFDDIVVGGVTSVDGVIDQSAPQGTGLPPKVFAVGGRAREDAGGLAVFVAVVVAHGILSLECSSGADGVCISRVV